VGDVFTKEFDDVVEIPNALGVLNLTNLNEKVGYYRSRISKSTGASMTRTKSGIPKMDKDALLA
jgi:hypothetical protein